MYTYTHTLLYIAFYEVFVVLYLMLCFGVCLYSGEDVVNRDRMVIGSVQSSVTLIKTTLESLNECYFVRLCEK